MDSRATGLRWIHWRESVLEAELMGGMQLWRPSGAALSAITVQSFADLGYGVDISQADPYTLPGAAGKASAKIAAAKPSIPGVDATPSGACTQPGVAAALPLIPNDRLRGRLESAEWIGDRVYGPWDDRLMGRLAPSPRAVPELSRGAGLRREPIHVIDAQGYIVRTISSD